MFQLFFRAYQFKLEEVEAFRYRAKDAWRAVTRIAVREARLKEIKQEIFNSQKLKVRLVKILFHRLNFFYVSRATLRITRMIFKCCDMIKRCILLEFSNIWQMCLNILYRRLLKIWLVLQNASERETIIKLLKAPQLNLK